MEEPSLTLVDNGKGQLLLRFATSLQSLTGEKRGGVTLDINSHRLFSRFDYDHEYQDRLMLVGDRAAWLATLMPEKNLLPAFTQAWLQMQEQGRGLLRNAAGLFVFDQLPVPDREASALPTKLVLVGFVPAAELRQDKQRFIGHLMLIFGVFAFLLATLFFYSRGIIWDRLRIMARLDAKQAFLDSVLESSADTLITIRLNGEIVASNQRGEELFGYAQGELDGIEIEQLLPSEYQVKDIDYDHHYKTLKDEGREFERAEAVGIRHSGIAFPVELTLTRLKGEGERRLLLIIRDIEDQKAAELELDNLRIQYFQQEKMAQIGLLVAGILHEVGNPLAAIRGVLEQMVWQDGEGVSQPLSEEHLESIELVLKQTDRIRNITHEISGFISPNQNERGLLDINAILEGTTGLLGYDNRWKQIRLELDLDRQVPAIEGVADQLTQAFMNLLVNASDAFEGLTGREPVIRVVSERLSRDIVRVTIQDNGVGISTAHLMQVFDPFFTTKPRGKGTGLGLSICDKIIEDHDGKLEVESIEGVGTAIRILFIGDQSAN
jgi:PAS domain S-box-containing protein